MDKSSFFFLSVFSVRCAAVGRQTLPSSACQQQLAGSWHRARWHFHSIIHLNISIWLESPSLTLCLSIPPSVSLSLTLPPSSMMHLNVFLFYLVISSHISPHHIWTVLNGRKCFQMRQIFFPIVPSSSFKSELRQGWIFSQRGEHNGKS